MPSGLMPMEALRTAAEKQLASKKAWINPDAGGDNLKLIHELQVHQIELEMQNEELTDALAEVDTLRAKYQDLFENAPVGYFILSRNGEVLDINRHACALMGYERPRLTGRQIREFFSNESLADAELFFTTVRQTNQEVAVHGLVLRSRHKLPQYVNAQARSYVDAASGELQIRLTLMDVSALKAATDDVVKVISKVSGFGPL